MIPLTWVPTSTSVTGSMVPVAVTDSANLAFTDGGCGVGHPVLGLCATKEAYAAAHYDYGSYGNEDGSFFVHIYIRYYNSIFSPW